MAKSESVKKPLSRQQLTVLRSLIEAHLGPAVENVQRHQEKTLERLREEYRLACEERDREVLPKMLAEARRRPSTYIVQARNGRVELDLQALYDYAEKRWPKPTTIPLNEHDHYERVVFAALKDEHSCERYMTWQVPKCVAPIIQELATQIDTAVLNGAADGLIEAIQESARKIAASDATLKQLSKE